MQDNEKGFKWWIRYVIVPIICSSGLLAIISTIIYSAIYSDKHQRINPKLITIKHESNTTAQGEDISPPEHSNEPQKDKNEGGQPVHKETENFLDIGESIWKGKLECNIKGQMMQRQKYELQAFLTFATSQKDDNKIKFSIGANKSDEKQWGNNKRWLSYPYSVLSVNSECRKYSKYEFERSVVTCFDIKVQGLQMSAKQKEICECAYKIYGGNFFLAKVEGQEILFDLQDANVTMELNKDKTTLELHLKGIGTNYTYPNLFPNIEANLVATRAD